MAIAAVTETDAEKLQDIIDRLPDPEEYPGPKRREYSLTKGDVLIVYEIAKIANTEHKCPFKPEVANTLNGVGSNINKTTKIASGLIIAAIVGGILTGVWSGIVHIVTDAIKALALKGGS